jgi:flavin-dependent dehydrogenase
MSMADVCIAGGGPAGLAAALALRRQGFRVTVVDCAAPPIDKACGEGLLPDSLVALKSLGVELDAGAGQPFRGLRFIDGASIVTGDFPNGTGLGMRRTFLHEVLVRQAKAAEVRMIWGAKDVRLCGEGLSVQGEVLRARIVVGADGQKSTIRKMAGLDAIRSERRRYGFRTHYRVAPWSEYVEVYWGARGQAYITPIACDEVCVAFVSRDSRLRLEEALSDFPRLRERLAGAPHASPEKGALSMSRQLKRVHKDGLALLGDASGSVDAITGEGLCLAFKQADALAAALRAGDLRQYAARHRSISAKPRMMASLMLSMEWHNELQRRVLASLAKRPQVFESILRFSAGERPRAGLMTRQLLGFGWGFLTA